MTAPQNQATIGGGIEAKLRYIDVWSANDQPLRLSPWPSSWRLQTGQVLLDILLVFLLLSYIGAGVDFYFIKWRFYLIAGNDRLDTRRQNIFTQERQDTVL